MSDSNPFRFEVGAIVVECIYSPDEGGWYCEMWEKSSGKTVHTTAVFGRQDAAMSDAVSYANSL
jgi:hypothetical protein